jgi:DNA (cytosine-5)-methyltransferase 1
MELYIFNQSDRKMAGIIEAYEYLRWTRRYSQCGSFEIKAIATAENIALLQIGNILWKNDDEEAGLIEFIEMTMQEQEFIVASGRFATSFLARRIVLGTYNLTGDIGSALASLIISSIIAPGINDRKISGINYDFTGERAGEILFDETRLSGNSAAGGAEGQKSAGSSAVGTGSAICLNDHTRSVAAAPVPVLNDQGGTNMDLSENITGTLRAQEHGHAPIVFEPGAVSRLGGHAWSSEPTGALRADMGDNQLAVAIENHPADSRVKISEDGIVQTLPSRMGTGGGNVPLVMNERQYALTVGEDVANTLTGTDYKGTQCVFEPAAFMGGQGAKARSIAYSEETSPTLRSEAGGNSVPMAVYGICSKSSNSMKSGNPHSGIYEADTARTLDTSVPDPNKNAGGMAVVALEGNGSRPSHRGDGFSDEDISYTLNSVEHHAVCYQDKVGSLCASDYKFPQNQQIDEGKVVVENYQHSGYREVEQAGTLKASGGDYPGGENLCVENRYVVRRLTPTECALLQGFPADWCAGLGTAEPTEEDIAFWSEVWETHRNIIGTSSKPKSRNQMVKWLKDPHSDSAEYKMWGNGVALPCVVFILGGIVYSSRN